MKKITLILVFVVSTGFVFGQGVNFEKLSFKEALAKAKTENKYLFIDCYTSWCGPCKQMREQILTQAIVGDYFNARFVSVEYDVEKEELELRKEFDVKVFPTYLILTPDGTLYHKLVGSSLTADDFIAKVKQGMIQENSLCFQTKLHASGKMNNEQLKNYYFLLKEIAERDRSVAVLNELAARLSKEERMQADYWFLIENQQYGDEGFLFVMENLEAIRKNVGDINIDLFLYRCFSGAIDTYLKALAEGKSIEMEKTTKILKKLRQQLSIVDMKNKTSLLEQIDFLEAYLQNNSGKILHAIEIMTTSKQGNLWILPQILQIVRAKKDKTLTSGVKAMKDTILTMFSTQTDREKFEELIDNLDK